MYARSLKKSLRINMKGDNEKWLDLFIYLFIAGNPQILLIPIYYSCRLAALGKIVGGLMPETKTNG
jgi:hypothetical protein